jgi:tyrosyl-tRNA synthetase
VELIRRARGAEAHVITLPLVINKATGKKFGKSEEGAVWLDPERTSPYQFYQFWLNSDDDGVEDYLKVFTELDKPAVDKIMQDFHANRAGRAAQKALAIEVTKLIHGEQKAVAVQRATAALFGDQAFDGLSAAEIAILKAELPVVHAEGEENLPSLLVRSGLASSRSDAMRLLTSGAISLNGERVSEVDRDFAHPGNHLLRKGKNNFAVIES